MRALASYKVLESKYQVELREVQASDLIHAFALQRRRLQYLALVSPHLKLQHVPYAQLVLQVVAKIRAVVDQANELLLAGQTSPS